MSVSSGGLNYSEALKVARQATSVLWRKLTGTDDATVRAPEALLGETEVSKTGTNDFQHGISEVRKFVAEKCIGRLITCDKDDAFSGSWAGPQRVTGVIERALTNGSFVAGVRFEGEDVSSLSAASFMLNTTTWEWETADTPAPRDDDLPGPKGIKHERGARRAYDLALLIAERVGLSRYRQG
jgi:hypothetical protein